MTVGGYSSTGGYGEGGFSRLSRDLETAAVSFASMASAAAVFKTSITTFAALQDQIIKTGAVAGATTAEMQKMDSAVRKLSTAVRTTSVEGANALYFLTSAGYDAGQAMSALSGVALLAAATMEPIAQTADVVASSLQAFQLESYNSTRVANLFVASILRSQSSMDKLAYSMRQVAPVAAAVGLSIEDTTTSLSILYNSGLRGEQAGTALRNTLVELSSPTARARALLKEMGLTTLEAAGGFESMMRTIAKYNLSISQVEALVGKEAASGFITLMESMVQYRDESGNLTSGFDELRNKLVGTNAAFEQAIKQNQSLAAQGAILRNNLTELTVVMGDGLAPVLGDLITYVTELTREFHALDDSTKQYYATYAALVGVLVIAIPVITVLAKTGGLLIAFFVKAAELVAAFRVGLAALAVGGAAAFAPMLITVGLVAAAFYAAATAFDYFAEKTAREASGDFGSTQIGKMVNYVQAYQSAAATLEAVYTNTASSLADKVQSQGSIIELGQLTTKNIEQAIQDAKKLDSDLAALAKANNVAQAKILASRKGFSFAGQEELDVLREDKQQLNQAREVLKDRIKEYEENAAEIRVLNEVAKKKQQDYLAQYVDAFFTEKDVYRRLVAESYGVGSQGAVNSLKAIEKALADPEAKKVKEDILARIKSGEIDAQNPLALVEALREWLKKYGPETAAAVEGVKNDMNRLVAKSLEFLDPLAQEARNRQLDALATLEQIFGSSADTYAARLKSIGTDVNLKLREAGKAFVRQLEEQQLFLTSFSGDVKIGGGKVQIDQFIKDVLGDGEALAESVRKSDAFARGDVEGMVKAGQEYYFQAFSALYDQGLLNDTQKELLQKASENSVKELVSILFEGSVDTIKFNIETQKTLIDNALRQSLAQANVGSKNTELDAAAAVRNYDFAGQRAAIIAAAEQNIEKLSKEIQKNINDNPRLNEGFAYNAQLLTEKLTQGRITRDQFDTLYREALRAAATASDEYVTGVREIEQKQAADLDAAYSASTEFLTQRSTKQMQLIADAAQANADFAQKMFPYNEEQIYTYSLQSIQATYEAGVQAAEDTYARAMAAITNPDSANGQQLVQEAMREREVALGKALQARDVAQMEADITRATTFAEAQRMADSLIESATKSFYDVNTAMSQLSASYTETAGTFAVAQYRAVAAGLRVEAVDIERQLRENAIRFKQAIDGETDPAAQNALARQLEITNDALTARKTLVLEQIKVNEVLYDSGILQQEAFNKLLKEQLELSQRINQATNSLFGGFTDAARKAVLDSQTLFYDLGEEAYSILSTRVGDGIADAFQGTRVQWGQLLKNMAADWLRSGLTSLVRAGLATAFSGGFGSAQANGVGALQTIAGAGSGGAGGIANLLSMGSSGLNLLKNGLNTSIFSGGTAAAIDSFGYNVFGIGNKLILPGGAEGASVMGGASGSFTPGAAVAGFAGNFGANALFGDRGIGADIGGALGGIGGTLATQAITTALAMTPFAPLAPFLGPLLGSFGGNVLGGLFGGKKSDATAAGAYNLVTGSADLSDLGSKTSQANKDFREAVSTFSSGLVQQLITDTQKYVDANLTLQIGSRDGLRYGLNGAGERNFGGNSAEFFKNLTKDLVGLFEGADKGQQRIADLNTAIANIDFKDGEQAIKDIQFALNFTDLGAADEITDAKRALKDLSDTFNEAAKNAERLGLSVEYVREKQAQAEQKLRDDFLKQYGDAYINSLSSSIGSLTSVIDEYESAIKNANDLGVDTTVVRLFYEEQLRQAINSVNESENQRIAVLKKSSDEANKLMERWKTISENLQDTIDKLKVSNQSTLSPFERYTEARRQFESAFSLATSGTGEEAANAASSLGALSSTFLNLSKEYFASSTQYAADYEQVQAYLGQAQGYAAKQVDKQQVLINEIQRQTAVIQDSASQLIATISASLLGGGADFSQGGSGKIFRTNGSFAGYISAGNFNYKLTEAMRTGALSPEQLNQLKGINASLFPSLQAGNGAFDMAYENSPAKNLQALLLARQLGIPGFMRGGVTPIGRPFIVGEAGPELMMSGAHHTVTPLTNTANLADSLEGYKKQSAAETMLLAEKLETMNNRLDTLVRALERSSRK